MSCRATALLDPAGTSRLVLEPAAVHRRRAAETEANGGPGRLPWERLPGSKDEPTGKPKEGHHTYGFLYSRHAARCRDVVCGRPRPL